MVAGPLVVLTTFSNVDDARRVVREMVERRLVACGTVVPGATSVYRWEGAVTEEDEVLVFLKTDAARWEELARAVTERHPYELPELLALPVSEGLDRYLSWLAGEVGP
ncbi:MAG TPA: divalent-cation tolerance protein CutA [Gemmatimonadales bacterium]